MDASTSTWALIIVTGAGALTAPIAFGSYMFGKRTRAEDKAQEFGRLEGWANREGNRRSGGDDTIYSIGGLREAAGGLKEAVDNLKSDIKDLRQAQERDRTEHQALRDTINEMQRDISAMRRQFQEVMRKLNAK